MSFVSSQFSYLLFVKFYEKCFSIDGWTEISNDFVADAAKLVGEFSDYKSKIDDKLNKIHKKNQSEIEKEIEEIKILNDMWIQFVKKYCRLEANFEDKYKDKSEYFESYLENVENCKMFLADYSAFQYMQTIFEPLMKLEITLEDYYKTCQSYNSKFKPA